VRVAQVDRASLSGSTRYSAQILPATRVDLAFKVGGYVALITKVKGVDGRPRVLQEGDPVTPGMLLAALRATDFAQRVDESSAGFAQAKAAAEQATIDFARASKLSERGTIAEAELDNARLAHDSTAAALAGAQARADQARTALGDTSLRSPIDGIVIKRSIEEGSLAAPGTHAFSVAETKTVKAVFGVPDTALASVRIGAEQSITTEAYPNDRFQGRISRVSPTADVNGRVFEVEIALANSDQRLKPGMVAALSLAEGSAPNAGRSDPVVPISAIVRSPAHPGQFAVFVVETAGKRAVARSKEVVLGEYLGSVIPVRQGLAGGEKVVVQGAGLLSDGEAVEIIP
jgi:multidrug efflux system membrane fusion protein